MFKINPNSRSIAEGISLAVIGLCLLALFLWFLYTIRVVFLYIILSAILALMGRPFMFLLHRKLRLNSTLSASITVLIFLFILSFSLYFLVPLILQQADTITGMDTTQIQTIIFEQLSALNEVLLRYRIDVLDEFLKSGYRNAFDISVLTSWFSNIIQILTQFSIGSFSVLFITFFFLKERNLFNGMLLSPVPDMYVNRVASVIQDIKNLLSRYFIGITMQVFIMFSLYYLVLLLFGGVEADKALIIALLCALCNIVPYVGPLVGFFMIILLSMSNLYSQGFELSAEILPKVYWIAGGYLFAQLIDNFVNQPLIYSKSVKSHPLEIFLIIIIGGLLAGVGGVILAVPFYTIIRVILKEFFSEFKFVQSITKNI
ncbi:MAG: AI-2E family transporter [Flavobacteriaceae bacterium]|nr:AI-2E family transporter [Flavobacteriaceae bacterium]